MNQRRFSPLFDKFRRRHEAINRFWRSTEICYRLTQFNTESRDSTEHVRSLFTSAQRRRRLINAFLKQYRPKVKRGEHVSIGDLQDDITENLHTLIETVIVKEENAFEQFVRGWALAANNAALQGPKGSLPADRRQILEKYQKRWMTRPQSDVSLKDLKKCFPLVVNALASVSPLRASYPMLTAATAVSCLDATGMWRQVRNLILHQGRVVDKKFAQKWSETWEEIAVEAQQSGLLIELQPVVPGELLPLHERHAVFCLTSCHQAVEVFRTAFSGTET